MLCQVCKQNDASVHVTEVNQVFHPDPQGGKEIAKLSAQERHLCEACAQAAKLPHQPAGGVAEIWKLLQASQQKRQKRETAGLTCPECGMTLRDFRQRGRLGCAKDYEVFGAQLRDLLDIAIQESERFYPAFQSVVWGGKSPAEALEIALFETIAEA